MQLQFSRMRARVLLAILIIAISGASNNAARAEYSNDMSKPITHPVLHFTKPEQLHPEDIDAATFKKLLGLYDTCGSINYLRDDMLDGEAKACAGIERIIKGRTPDEIKDLIGDPELISGQIKTLNDSTPEQINWFYYMGYNCLPLRVAFENGHCTFAKLCYAKERSKFEKAVFKEIQAYSLGKSKEEISIYLRKPLKDLPGLQVWQVIHLGDLPPANDPYDYVIAKDMILKTAMSYHVSEFRAGNDFLLGFRFNDGKCSGVRQAVLFH